MAADKKATVPIPSAATDGGQPSAQTRMTIVSDKAALRKSGAAALSPEDQEILHYFRARDKSRRDGLPTTTLTQLMEQSFPVRPAIIENLLYQGTYLFVGAPKVGKSFLMAQLAFHISTGLPLWGRSVQPGGVLYLALEDSYARLQSRLYRMFGPKLSDRLYFAVSAKPLGNGLEKQLKCFLQQHSDVQVIIIDTLQKIRSPAGDTYSYASDYEVISGLSHLAADAGLCLLLVHHTRKQQASDCFDMISGTNGLLGAADGAFLLHKDHRTDCTAVLEVSGRDQQDQRLYLRRNEASLLWELEREETDLWKPPPEPLLEAVAKLVTPEQPEWAGTATQLLDALGLALDLKANTLSLRLNVNAGRLLEEYHIEYHSTRSHTGRRIQLRLCSGSP